MLQGIWSSSSANTSQLSKLFSKLDANNDKSVSKNEFVAGKPSDVTDDQASSMFDSLDSSKSGSLSESGMQTAFQQMATLMQSVLIQAQSDSSSTQQDGPPDSSEMFSSLDTDGDGSVTRSEFLAGKPDDISDEQAGAFFDKIAGKNGDSLTQAQFTEGMKSMAPPSHGPQSASGGGSPPDSSEMFSSLDADGDGSVSRAEFLAGRPDNVSEDQAGAFFDKIAGNNGDSLTQAQFTEGLKSAGPPSDSTQTASTSDSSSQDDLLKKLLEALKANEKDNQDSQIGSSSSDTQTQASQMLDQFIKAVSSYQNTAYKTAYADVSLLGTSVAA